MTDLSEFQDELKCGNCRNSLKQSSKVNVTDLKQDIVIVRCDDCQKLFEQYPQFTASFAVCTCEGGAKEIDLAMAEQEEARVKEVSALDKIKENKDEDKLYPVEDQAAFEEGNGEEPLITEDEEAKRKSKKIKS